MGIRSFSNSDKLWDGVANTTPTVEVILLAGGGGGGYDRGGGGGAGGLLYTSGFTVKPNVSYTITVGAGAAGSTSANVPSGPSRGNNTLMTGLFVAQGGGGGKCADSNTGYNVNTGQHPMNGGSGGGGVGSGTVSGGLNTVDQGFRGGYGIYAGPNYGGAGGGGASAVGGNGTSTTAGAGGAGTNTYSTWMAATTSGVSNYIAGGGGGATYSGGTGGAGGAGGGGAGRNGGTGTAGGNGDANTGSGGGGGSGNPPANGGAGGSGLVLIRYADTYAAAKSTTGSPSTPISGGYRYYKFTGDGSITF